MYGFQTCMSKSLMADINLSMGVQESGVCGHCQQFCLYHGLFLIGKKRVHGSGKGMPRLQGEGCGATTMLYSGALLQKAPES